MEEEQKRDPMTEDSVAKRLSNIENALERIEKSQDTENELLQPLLGVYELQLESVKLQTSIAESQKIHEDVSIEQFRFALDQAKFGSFVVKSNLYFTVSVVALSIVSMGIALQALGIAKDNASTELSGEILMYAGFAIFPIFMLLYYIGYKSGRKAEKRDANK